MVTIRSHNNKEQPAVSPSLSANAMMMMMFFINLWDYTLGMA